MSQSAHAYAPIGLRRESATTYLRNTANVKSAHMDVVLMAGR